MPHEIIFENVYNTWNNALPLGNGKMGAMVFFSDHKLHIALNHYDCYYDVLQRYSGKKPVAAKPARVYEDYCQLANKAREAEDHQYAHYTDILNPAAKERRPNYSTTSYPMSGEIVIGLNKSIEEFTLKLIIEEGIVLLQGKGSEVEATAKIWIAKSKDGLFVEMTESAPCLWAEAELSAPSAIGQSRYKSEHFAEDNVRKYTIEYGDKAAETAITTADGCVVASVMPKLGACTSHNDDLLQMKDNLAAEHKKSWKDFWRATVQLPDYFLETLWYLHLYALACASGQGGRYFQQACGLNGLWDIRRPNLWSSTWYWDVNIQEAFWPVFSSNQLEMGKLFCDAYLSYAESVERFTESYYGVKEGWALDYPHMLYNCIQPWCAQFLWRYYSYSGDLDFLRDNAYPVFAKQIAHFKHIASVGDDGKLHIMYDISPEQGPITQDSVVTIASIKQLLKYAIKAADILGRPDSEKEEYTCLYDKLPGYTTTSDNSRWKDSALTQDDLFLRHPSILMPIFPAEEVHKGSDKETRRLAIETLRHASENTEIGVFGAGWLSSAAAKMGEGTAALRILYEKGLDYFIHSNGLGYEESERYVNLCLITKPPLYPPAMMEPSGGIVMAVNAMLLDSDNFIEVFPAVPNGHDNIKIHKAQYRHQNDFLSDDYPAWDNCRFDSMLAAGGFEVSAERKDGKTTWINVSSIRGGVLRLLLPENLSPDDTEMIYTKEMKPGETITFGSPGTSHKAVAPTVQTRKAATTGRRVFLGEDRHIDFYKKVDSFACAYLMGNAHQYQMLPYIFDFGDSQVSKNYDDVFHKAFCYTGRSIVFFGAPKRLGPDIYQGNTGYGFSSIEGIAVLDRKSPDDMRRDFVEGTQPTEFTIELPRGKYNVLLISGDEDEASITHINLPHINGNITGEIMKPGRYQCQVVPFMQEKDGLFKLGLATEGEYKWKLNAIFICKEYYM